jgi:Carboxypeptidase regulatory-like domain
MAAFHNSRVGGWLLAFLVGSCTLLPAGCVRRVHDYTFSVTGYVTADDGSPLEDVQVVLQVDAPVYEGITPLKTQRIVTNNGGFIFMYLTGNLSTKYTVTVSKDGYETQTVSGSSPPAGHHTVRLKRASSETR